MLTYAVTGSPADGLVFMGDLLLSIDEQLVDGLTLDKVRELFFGPPHSVCAVTVLRRSIYRSLRPHTLVA
jgi:hypothetical protein